MRTPTTPQCLTRPHGLAATGPGTSAGSEEKQETAAGQRDEDLPHLVIGSMTKTVMYRRTDKHMGSLRGLFVLFEEVLYTMHMKQFANFVVCSIVLVGCNSVKAPSQDTSSVLSQYHSPHYDITVTYPTTVARNPGDDALVPVRVVEDGEIISFVRADQTLEPHAPYYPNYAPNQYPYESPAQLYVAKVTNETELKEFVQRAYGSDCLPGGPSFYGDNGILQTYTVTSNGSDCPGAFPVGDIVRWNTQKHVAIGIQTMGDGLYKPTTDPTHTLDGVNYMLVVDGFMTIE